MAEMAEIAKIAMITEIAKIAKGARREGVDLSRICEFEGFVIILYRGRYINVYI